MAVAISSGYATWVVLNNLLSNKASQHPVLITLKGLYFGPVSNDVSRNNEDRNKSAKALDVDDIESEIAVFAQTFHTHLVLPWYTVVSPDEKYSRQIKCTLQDMLSNVVMHIQLNSHPCDLICSFVYIYIQHYRHYINILEKLNQDNSGNTKMNPAAIQPDDIAKCYKPLHCALKSDCGVDEYCKKLSHIFLVDHLPQEITHCSLLFTLIRDAFARNVLVVLLNRVSEPSFLNELVLQVISNSTDFGSVFVPPDMLSCPQNNDGSCVDVPMSYVHRLSLIHEESSIDLLETDLAALSRLLPETIIEEDCCNGEETASPADEADTPESYITFPEMSIECALGTLISTTAAPILSRQYPLAGGHLPSAFKLPMEENYRQPEAFLITDDHDVIEEMEEFHPETRNSTEFLRPSTDNDKKSAKCLQRSSSLEDVLSLEKPQTAFLAVHTSSKLSFSSEDLRLVAHKGKRLVKMASFDKNDGTDEQSLHAGRTEMRKTFSNISSRGDRSPTSFTETAIINSEDSIKQLPEVEAKQKLASPPEESTDLSPIYEESESLATAIEKLRSLLTEKESYTSLGSQSSFGSSDSDPKSAQSDPGRYCLEKSRFNFLHKDSSGSLASIKSYSSSESCGLEDVMEVPEVPFDGRVFISISIPTTEAHTDATSGQCTLFVIQYDAIYLCESVASDNPISSNLNGTTHSESKMIIQTNSVKRRFEEFLALHAAIEEDPTFKAFLKTIKGPNKWLNLPFSKLDSATVSSRKQFLEKYLSALIHPVELNISPQLKDFLAYCSKSSVSFVKKPLELNVPRIDKILARTVSGMFHSIKTALPTFDSVDNNVIGGPVTIKSVLPFTDSLKCQLSEKKLVKSPLNPGPEYKLKIDVTAEEDFCEMEGALVKEISSASFKNSPIEAAYEALETHQFADFFLAKRDNAAAEDGQTLGSPENFWKELKRAVLLSSQQNTVDEIATGKYRAPRDGVKLYLALCDLFVELLSTSDSVWTRDCTVKLMENLLVEDLSKLLQTKVNSIFDPTNFKETMAFLTNLIEKSAIDKDDNSSFTPERLSDELTSYLSTAAPGVTKLLFGQELMEKHTRLLVSSFQHRIINLDLGLHFLDLVFSQFISK